jgi:hypothetical protein
MNGSHCPVSSRRGKRGLRRLSEIGPPTPDLFNAENPLIVRDSALVSASRTSRAACQHARLSGNTRIFTVNELATIVSILSRTPAAEMNLVPRRDDPIARHEPD